MTATATRMQLLVPSAKYFGALTPIKKLARTYTYKDSAVMDHVLDPAISDDLLPDITVSETGNILNISVPLRGMDARKVFVVASARSILIEVRMTRSICPSGFIRKELQQKRVTRELSFHESIVAGSTVVHYFGNDLEITCLKGNSADDGAWSELLSLNTRTSLGCVG